MQKAKKIKALFLKTKKEAESFFFAKLVQITRLTSNDPIDNTVFLGLFRCQEAIPIRIILNL